MINNIMTNDTKQLMDMQGERIKGVVWHNEKQVLIFESGYGFWFNSFGNFGYMSVEDINTIIRNLKEKLIYTKTTLEETLKALGETIEE